MQVSSASYSYLKDFIFIIQESELGLWHLEVQIQVWVLGRL